MLGLMKQNEDWQPKLRLRQRIRTFLKSPMDVATRWFYFFAPRHFTVSLFACVTTITTARVLSYYNPNVHFELQDVHLHHFFFGIFALAIAAYGAMEFTGPRARPF